MHAVMTPDCNGVCSVDETASGSVHVHLKPCVPGSRSSMLREKSLVVLTLSKPPAKGALEWVQGGRGRGARRQNGSSDDHHHKRQRSVLSCFGCAAVDQLARQLVNTALLLCIINAQITDVASILI